MTTPRYTLVGGTPFTGYTGTTTFLDLKVVGTANNASELKQLIDTSYDDCGGLLLAIDMKTGAEATDIFDTKKG